MLDQFIDTVQKLIKKNEHFATATVVRRDAPSSGKVGDKAVIDLRGNIMGWVGGGCVKGILIKEAEDAMKSGKARLVKIGKNINNNKQNGVMEYKMTCQSEGTVEVYIEPILPKPHIVIIGKTEIARSLSKLAHACGYRITGVAHDANLQTFDKVDELITHVNLSEVKTTLYTNIIVCTQGEGDETALSEALKKESGFLGFVASRKKMISMHKYLTEIGFSDEKISSIKAPVGIDINAKKADEVAISILAELVAHQNKEGSQTAFEGFKSSNDVSTSNTAPAYYTNPVCGIPVDINNPKHIVEYNGEKVYFCCDGCKVKFDLEPQKYIKG
jgi:xanthine dehydrogenase accessory factor